MRANEFTNPKDVVSMDVPFLIRALEYAREDAKDDIDVHDAVERMISAAQAGEPLDMGDYNLVFGEQDVEGVAEDSGEQVWAVTGTWTHRKYMRDPQTTTTKVTASSPEEAMRKYKSHMWNEYERKVIDMKVKPYTKQPSTFGQVDKQGVAEGSEPTYEIRLRKNGDDKLVARNVPKSQLKAKLQALSTKHGAKVHEFEFFKKKGVAEGFADDFAAFAKERGGVLRHGPQPTKPATKPAAPQPAAPVDREALSAELKQLQAQFDPQYQYSDDYSFWSKQDAIANRIAGIKKQLGEGEPGDLEHELNRQEYHHDKIGGRYDADEFDAMVGRLKKLAGAGPMKTVYDPATRRYKNVPTARQPGDKK